MDGGDEKNHANIDMFPFEVAIVAADGTIVSVNTACEEFAAQNQGTDPEYWVGANYFDICRDAEDDPSASDALAGLQAVLTGDQDRYR